MNILIKNGRLISMAEDYKKAAEVKDIFIQGDSIVKIGSNLSDDEQIKELMSNNGITVIDATNRVIMPGLINTHSHVPMSIFRETVDGYNLQDWLTKKIWPMEDKLTKNDIYYASLLTFIEMIKTGCTTINDMYFMADNTIQAMKKTGIRMQTSRALMNMVSDEDGEDRFKEILGLMDKYKDEPNVTFNAGIHGLYTSTEPYVKKCIQFAKANNLPVHMHFCENTKEVEDITGSYNSSPIDVLIRNFHDTPVLLAHVVKLSKDDVEKLSELNVSISHCPISNLKLGCGIAPIIDMLKNGINVSLGTDGQGSGCSVDMFEVMKFTALLQKGINETPDILNSYDVLKMATINGAKALGLQDEIGTIEEGKKADIIILNMDRVKAVPENDLISQIVFNTNGEDVETTIVNGKILMLENELKLDEINEKDVFEECKKIIKRIS